MDNYIILIIVGAVLLALLIFFTILIISRRRKQRDEAPLLPDKSEYLLALGGEDNIKEKSLNGSRISVKLEDYDKADFQKLLEIGVDSYIKMSDKMILIVKDHAQEVYEKIFH